MNNPPFKANIEADISIYNELEYIGRELIDDYCDLPEIEKYISKYNESLSFFKDTINKNEKLIDVIKDKNQKIVKNAENVQQILTQIGYDKEEIHELELSKEIVSRKLDACNKKKRERLSTLEGIKNDYDCYSSISNEFIAKENEKERLKKDNDMVRSDIESNSKIIDELKEELQQAKNEKQTMDDALSSKKEEFDGLTKDVDETTELIATLKNNNTKYLQDLQDMHIYIEKLDNEANEGKEKLKNTVIDPSLQYKIQSMKDDIKSEKEKGENAKIVIAFKKRTVNTIKKNEESTTQQSNKLKHKITKREATIDELKKDLKKVEKEFNESKPICDEATEKQKKLNEEKVVYRKKYQDLINHIIDLELANMKVTNASNMAERRNDSEVITLLAEQKNIEHEKCALIEVENQESILVTETMNIRTVQQKMKEIASKKLLEIDAKRVEASQTRIYLNVTKLETVSLIKQNEQLSKELKVIKEKTMKQASINDRLISERNQYKKLCEAAEAETVQLQSQFNDLVIKIKEMTTRIDTLIEENLKDRAATKVIKDTNEVLAVMKEETRVGMKTSESVNARLIQEAVQLHNLHGRLEWEFRQQKKEYAMLINSYQIVSNQLLQRDKKIEQLKSDVLTNVSVIEKSKKVYIEKCNELFGLEKDYQYYIGVNRRLTELWNKTSELAKKETLLSEELNIEKLKKTKLMNDMDVPRNVHRYTLLEATNPELAKQYRYVFYVHFRIAEACAELKTLKEELKNLQKKYDRMQDHGKTDLSKEDCKSAIKKYQDDIKAKDLEMEEMERTIKQLQEGIIDENEHLNSTKLRVSQRRSMTANLKSRKAMMTRIAENDGFFITGGNQATVKSARESRRRIDDRVDYVTTFGGGFLPKAPNTSRDSRRFIGRAPSPVHDEKPYYETNQNEATDSRNQKNVFNLPRITKVKKSLRMKRKASPQSARRSVRASAIVN